MWKKFEPEILMDQLRDECKKTCNNELIKEGSFIFNLISKRKNYHQKLS